MKNKILIIQIIEEQMKKLITSLSLFILLTTSCITFAQNFLVKTNCPAWGYISNLVINTRGYIFAGTDYGVYRSTDNGDNWIQINNGLKYDSFGKLGTHAVAIDSNQNIFISVDNEVYRSTDNGDNWTKIKSGLIADIAINSIGHIFLGAAAEEVNIYHSTNNGASWTNINNGLNSDVDHLAINSRGHIFAGCYDGIYRSTDNGDNWAKLINFYDEDAANSIAGPIAINSNGHIFTQISSQGRVYGEGDGVYRSTNNGDNWTRIIKHNGSQIKNFGGATVIAFGKSGHIYIGTRDGLYRSRDNRNNWTQLSRGLNPNDTGYRVDALVINSKGYIFAGFPDGIYRSSRGDK